MAEYQVQTHQYGAEYGGSTGVVVNSVTKSGSNKLSGRVFEYFQDNKLQATDYFLKQAGEENPDSGSNVFGGSIGGPIIPNKAFYFFNYEGTHTNEAANLNFPASAAPLAVFVLDDNRFLGAQHVPATRLQLERQQSFQLPLDVVKRFSPSSDSIENNKSIPDNATHENDAGDHVYSFSWTSILNNRTTNEARFGHVRESLLQGSQKLFDSDWNFIGFHGVDPFDVGIA